MTNDKTLAKKFCHLVSHTPKKKNKKKKKEVLQSFLCVTFKCIMHFQKLPKGIKKHFGKNIYILPMGDFNVEV